MDFLPDQLVTGFRSDPKILVLSIFSGVSMGWLACWVLAVLLNSCREKKCKKTRACREFATPMGGWNKIIQTIFPYQIGGLTINGDFHPMVDRIRKKKTPTQNNNSKNKETIFRISGDFATFSCLPLPRINRFWHIFLAFFKHTGPRSWNQSGWSFSFFNKKWWRKNFIFQKSWEIFTEKEEKTSWNTMDFFGSRHSYTETL